MSDLELTDDPEIYWSQDATNERDERDQQQRWWESEERDRLTRDLGEQRLGCRRTPPQTVEARRRKKG